MALAALSLSNQGYGVKRLEEMYTRCCWVVGPVACAHACRDFLGAAWGLACSAGIPLTD